MADLARIEKALRAADAAGDTQAATQLAQAYREAQGAQPAPAEPREGEDYGNEGRAYPAPPPTLREQVVRAAEAVGAPFAKVGELGANAIKDTAIGVAKGFTDLPQLGDKVARRAGLHSQPLQKTETLDRMYDEAGPVAALGRVAPTAAIMAPLGAAGGTGGFLADVAGNAAYGAADAYGEGRDPLTGAAVGAAGAAGGRFVGRMAAGAKPIISDEARQLVDRGVLPTPGQMLKGPTGAIVRKAEDSLTSIPLVGSLVQNARDRSLSDYGRVTINDALKPLGKSAAVKSGGVEGVEAAQRMVSDAFERGLDGMEVQPQMVLAAYDAARQHIPRISMLDEGQAAKVLEMLDDRVSALLANGSGGQAAKQFDSELGYMARKYSRSPNPGDHPIGAAFSTAQIAWREAMGDVTSGGNNALVRQANDAYRRLLPVVKASDKAMAKGGVFTPNQFMRSKGQFHQAQDPFDRAAQSVLPSTVADSGTAGRLFTGSLIGGGAIIPGASATAIAASTALAALAYSRPGINFVVNGMGSFVAPQVRAALLQSAPKDAVQLMQRLAKNNPQFAQQLAAQLGRLQAQQEGQQ